MAHSHYLNQSWLITNWNSATNLVEILIKILYISFKNVHFITNWSSATNLVEILIKILYISFKNVHWKMFAKCKPFCVWHQCVDIQHVNDQSNRSGQGRHYTMPLHLSFVHFALTYRSTERPGVVIKPVFTIPLFSLIVILRKWLTTSECHLHVWTMSLQHISGDNCQIWSWFKVFNWQFYKIKNFFNRGITAF